MEAKDFMVTVVGVDEDDIHQPAQEGQHAPLLIPVQHRHFPPALTHHSVAKQSCSAHNATIALLSAAKAPAARSNY